MDHAHTTSYAFDDRNIQWGPIEVPGCGVLPDFEFAPLAGSMELKVVDFLIKFPPKKEVNGRVVNLIHTHRHCGITNLFVIAGAHHIYEPDGTLREVRPVGNYTVSSPGDVHTEGGGPAGGVVHYSVRGSGMLFEFVDDKMQVLGGLTLENLVAACGG
jgi:hypothetical protein